MDRPSIKLTCKNLLFLSPFIFSEINEASIKDGNLKLNPEKASFLNNILTKVLNSI